MKRKGLQGGEVIYEPNGSKTKREITARVISLLLVEEDSRKSSRHKLRAMRLAALVDLMSLSRSISPLDIVVILLLTMKSGFVVVGIEVRIGLRHDAHVSPIHSPRIAVIGIVIIS